MKVKACIKSMRLRTLPLSVSGILMGIILASQCCDISLWSIITLILTAILLQILSNLSNELGDTLHGTDAAAERLGMHYSIMDGDMTIGQMRRLILVIKLLCCLSGALMVWTCCGTLFAILPIAFLLLGVITIWAATHYTMGDNPYGYKGWGDVFVYIFFGLVPTLGAACLCAHFLQWLWLLPASSIGIFSVAVLNVNNIRDMQTDVATRRTVALMLGLKRARIYQTLLIVTGWILLWTYTALSVKSNQAAQHYLYSLTLPFFIFHLWGVWTREGKSLDPMLPLLVIGTFLTTICFGLLA